MEQIRPLLNQTDNWIRFELGINALKGEAYFTEILLRAMKLCHALFRVEDEIVFGVLTYPHRINKPARRPKMKRYLRNPKVMYRLKSKEVSTLDYDEDEGSRPIYYSLTLKKRDIRFPQLLNAIAHTDFGGKPAINGQVYLFNKSSNLLFHMYDDRGCDVYACDQEVLRPIYHQFRSWILDYDRIRIDQAFGEGLAGIEESMEQKQQREMANEKGVMALGMNLRIDNACIIRHTIEVCKTKKNDCLEEMQQTGFGIEYTEATPETVLIQATKIEAIALIDYQSELMANFAIKYQGNYNGWTAQAKG